MARYQTGRLSEYGRDFQKLAEELYEAVRAEIGERALKLPGSYSVLGTRTDVRAGKVIIYEEGVGKGLRDELLRDGVYVLVRTNGAAEAAVWGGLRQTEPRFTPLFDRMDVGRTIEVAPNYDETFAFFLLRREDLAVAAQLLIQASRSLG